MCFRHDDALYNSTISKFRRSYNFWSIAVQSEELRGPFPLSSITIDQPLPLPPISMLYKNTRSAPSRGNSQTVLAVLSLGSGEILFFFFELSSSRWTVLFQSKPYEQFSLSCLLLSTQSPQKNSRFEREMNSVKQQLEMQLLKIPTCHLCSHVRMVEMETAETPTPNRKRATPIRKRAQKLFPLYIIPTISNAYRPFNPLSLFCRLKIIRASAPV